LFNLNLSRNNLSGQIPVEIGKLFSLYTLDLSGNYLTGTIPLTLGNCFKLTLMNLSRNELKGSIPYQLSTLKFLEKVDLCCNSLTGAIPPELGSLSILTTMNLSHNNLSGIIPSSFGSMLSLSSIDLSFNNLEGPIPDGKLFKKAPTEWFSSNKDLCGIVPGFPPCTSLSKIDHHSKKTLNVLFIIIILPCVLALLALVVYLLLHCRKENFHTENEDESVLGHLFSILRFDGRAVYSYIVNATENFNEKYCIGAGGYGVVYKVELPTGEMIAVKKLHSIEEEGIDERSFRNEIQMLTSIHHRNIVKLHGFCSHSNCKLLIYQYIERGSLATILCDSERSMELDWKRRVDVIKDVAWALSYMHHDCNLPIVHRDITCNNILLDAEFKAYISDFGIARILQPDSSNWSTLAGTCGYIAPGQHLYEILGQDISLNINIDIEHQ